MIDAAIAGDDHNTAETARYMVTSDTSIVGNDNGIGKTTRT